MIDQRHKIGSEVRGTVRVRPKTQDAYTLSVNVVELENLKHSVMPQLTKFDQTETKSSESVEIAKVQPHYGVQQEFGFTIRIPETFSDDVFFDVFGNSRLVMKVSHALQVTIQG